MKKRLLSLLLVCTMLVSILFVMPITANAASGTAGSTTWNLDSNGTLTITGTYLGNYGTSSPPPWYKYRTSIKKIVIEEGMTSIGYQTFMNCTKLTTLELPLSLRSIGSYAFKGCEQLSEVYLHDYIVRVGENPFAETSFYNNSKNWDNGVLYAGKCLLEAKSDITSVTIRPYTVSIAANAFFYNQNITEITIPESVLFIGEWAFGSCTNLSDISISEGLKYIDNYAFACLENLEYINIPSTIKEIGELAFSTSGLKKIDLPEGDYDIGYGAFMDCKDLKEAKIRNSYISSAMFSRCENLEYVVLGKKLEYVDTNAFVGCDKIKDVCYEGTEAEWKKVYIDESNVNLTKKLYYFGVASGAVSANMDSVKRLYVGEKEQIWVDVKPTNWWNSLSTTWASSNVAVATVDKNGYVTALSEGTAKIFMTTYEKATNSFVTKICDVYVETCNEIYDSYKYSFNNTSKSNYSYTPKSYVIPAEAYMQSGFDKVTALSMEKQKGFWGHCYGMSISSILFFKKILHEEKYNENVHIPKDFELPKDNPKLLNMLEVFTASQWINDIFFNGYAFNAYEISKELDLGNPVCFIMKDNNRGHAVVIYDYEKEGDIYTFDIYDNQGVMSAFEWNVSKKTGKCIKTPLGFISNINLDFTYWAYIPVSLILDLCEYLKQQGTISLFNSSKPQQTYVFRESNDFKVFENDNLVLDIENNQVIEIDEKIQMFMKGLEDDEIVKNGFKIPSGNYTLKGNGTEKIKTALFNEFLTVEITSKDIAPITFNENLNSISIETDNSDEFEIIFTTYDNVFDKIKLEGISNSSIELLQIDNIITVTGASAITATATVSEKESTVTAELAEGQEAIIECSEDENGNVILQILSGEEPMSDAVTLSEREQLFAPVYDLESGTYEEAQTLTFTKDENTFVYYTTDGSIPSIDNGYLYTLPIEINKSMTIKAVAIKYGYLDSDIVELNYTLPDVAEPTPDIKGGAYDDVVSVTLRAKDNLTDIYYTMDGSDPFENGELHTIPIVITEDCIIRAYSVKNGVISDEVEYEYSINSKFPFYLVNSPTEQNGELITKENISEVSKINLVVKNMWNEENSGYFMIAFYDENDKLLSIESEEKTITNETETVEIIIENSVDEAYKMKVFIWDSLNGLKPFSQMSEFIINYQEDSSV